MIHTYNEGTTNGIERQKVCSTNEWKYKNRTTAKGMDGNRMESARQTP